MSKLPHLAVVVGLVLGTVTLALYIILTSEILQQGVIVHQ